VATWLFTNYFGISCCCCCYCCYWCDCYIVSLSVSCWRSRLTPFMQNSKIHHPQNTTLGLIESALFTNAERSTTTNRGLSFDLFVGLDLVTLASALTSPLYFWPQLKAKTWISALASALKVQHRPRPWLLCPGLLTWNIWTLDRCLNGLCPVVGFHLPHSYSISMGRIIQESQLKQGLADRTTPGTP